MGDEWGWPMQLKSVLRNCWRWLPKVSAVLVLSLLLGGALVAFQTSSGPAFATPGPSEGWTQVVKGGFTDRNNSYLISWARFRDYLYVSTFAHESGSIFSGSTKTGSDIWRTADGITWEQVGTAGLGNPDNTSFQLIVFREKLYAIGNNEQGIEIWVTTDGSKFSKIESGGFGDKNNYFGLPLVFQDRLVVGVSNNETGAGIWVSDDGEHFRQVVDGGMGDPKVSGFIGSGSPEQPPAIFMGKLYLGVSNPDKGGEIWRTADGLEWERVADGGITRSSSIALYPDTVYQDHLYAFGTAGGTLDNLPGFDLFRTKDGTTWEQVVSNGFGVGEERNVTGGLIEYKGRLFLVSNTMDPRLLSPTNPTERLAPRGFQLRVSEDGMNWKQIGEDGFGRSTSLMAGLSVEGNLLYLTTVDYHQGNRLWRSGDGEKWEIIFEEPEPNFFQEGCGPVEFKEHLLWYSNDLKNGVEVWRSNEVLIAGGTATAGSSGSEAGSMTSGTSAVGQEDEAGEERGSAGDTERSEEGGSSQSVKSKSSELSGLWIALIAVLGTVAVAALGVVAFLVTRLTSITGASGAHAERAAMAADAGAAVASGVNASEATQGDDAALCSRCGAPLNPGSKFCAQCGSRV